MLLLEVVRFYIIHHLCHLVIFCFAVKRFARVKKNKTKKGFTHQLQTESKATRWFLPSNL